MLLLGDQRLLIHGMIDVQHTAVAEADVSTHYSRAMY